MSKKITLALIAAMATAAIAQLPTSGLLGGFTKAINEAQSLSTSYTVQVLGGNSETYKVDLKKPNLARIDSPSKLVVADGKEVTILDKASNQYYKQPQSEGLLKSLLVGDETGVWAGFFDPTAYQAAKVKDLGPKNRKGMTLNAVIAQLDQAGKKTITYFLGTEDKIARQALIEFGGTTEKTTLILDTKSMTVNGDVSANAFAFSAPENAKQTTLAAMSAAKWLTDIEEAKKVARASGKKIFVDFMATWCGPCKMLERDVFSTDRFKKLGTKLVFLRIDVDAQKSVASAYNIEAMPTQMVLDANGEVVGQTVGYGGIAAFFNWIDPLVN